MTLIIDGRPVRKFLFVRYSALTCANHLVEVHAFNKDHAVARLEHKWPYIARKEWDFLDELGPGHFVGKLGETLPLSPFGIS